MHNNHMFNHIAVAVAFSPRCEAIVAEAKSLSEKFGSNLTFIHVGKKSLQQEQYLKHLLHRFNLDAHELLWLDGDPVEMILQVCESKNTDLLVAGALEKDNLLKYILGGVARQLSRKAKCSMLMLVEPTIQVNKFNHLVVEGTDHEKTANTIAVAVEWAKAFGSNRLDIIQETDLTKMALIRSDELKENEADERKELLLKEEDERLQEIIDCNNCENLEIKTERIEGKPGYVISQFAKTNQADLLVLNGPDRKHNLLDRVFPHDIEYALADLPCNLLLVHPKNNND